LVEKGKEKSVVVVIVVAVDAVDDA